MSVVKILPDGTVVDMFNGSGVVEDGDRRGIPIPKGKGKKGLKSKGKKGDEGNGPYIDLM